ARLGGKESAASPGLSRFLYLGLYVRQQGSRGRGESIGKRVGIRSRKANEAGPKPALRRICKLLPESDASPQERTELPKCHGSREPPSDPSWRQHASADSLNRSPSATRSATRLCHHYDPLCPELLRIIDAWDRLPDLVKASILALVDLALPPR